VIVAFTSSNAILSRNNNQALRENAEIVLIKQLQSEEFVAI
jgi:hypothetical protein